MAQAILLACGMESFKILLAASNRGRAAHTTKKGPGRRHVEPYEDRRNDKLRETTEEYEDESGETRTRAVFVPFLHDETKLERAARHHKIGVRHGR
jgi:hypothetical protein